MIYNREEGEVTVLGDVQKYKVSIDEKNINHIVTILSSNLYSHPMISFLRETVSNAVDSHIEAKTDEPIVIYRTNNDLSIRDYGTGISPERFQEIYINIGSSTKRTSNDYIGNFGIGRFSSLSVADLVNVTSFYHGKAYYYVMNKDVDQLHIDLLYEKTTTEHDGVEVKVPIRTWNTETLRCLSFIDNLYVGSDVESDKWLISNFNQRKITTYKNFKIITKTFKDEYEHTEILFGKIPYKVDFFSLWDYSDDWHTSWYSTFKYVYPQLEIGDLDITPNRENLLYSERTKQALRKKYDECIEELKEMWTTQCNKEFEDFFAFVNAITSYRTNELAVDDNFNLPISSELAYNAIYKARPEWNNIPAETKKTFLLSMISKEIEVLGKFTNGELQQGNRVCGHFTIRRFLTDHWFTWENKMVLALPSKSGFTNQYFRGFVNETYKKDHKLLLRQLPKNFSIRYIRSQLKSMFYVSDYATKESRRFMFQLIRELLKYLSEHVIITDITGSKEYAQYKKDNAIKREFKHTENIRFSIYECTNWYPENVSMKTSEIIDYVKKEYNCKKHRIVYTYQGNSFIEPLLSMQYPNLVILAVAIGKVEALKKDLPKWIQPIETLYSEDNRTLQKYATIKYLKTMPRIFFDSHLFMPTDIREKVDSLRQIKERFSCKRDIGYRQEEDAKQMMEVIPKEKYDRTILALFHDTEKYMKVNYAVNSFSNVCMEDFYFLMKQKKIRLDYVYYKRIKDKLNELIKII